MSRIIIRALDVALSSVGLAFLSIPMSVVSFLIWLDDRGSPLFRQLRVGKNGKPFTIVKFRTMRIDVEQFQGEVRGAGDKSRADFRTTVANDPRITKLGRHLRRSHLDELPQLFNVLAGDMSMVGVRPDTPVQEDDYPAEYWSDRHRLRPGLTGPAQLYSDTATLSQRTLLEREWLADPSLRRYVTVLMETAAKVLKRTGN